MNPPSRAVKQRRRNVVAMVTAPAAASQPPSIGLKLISHKFAYSRRLASNVQPAYERSNVDQPTS